MAVVCDWMITWMIPRTWFGTFNGLSTTSNWWVFNGSTTFTDSFFEAYLFARLVVYNDSVGNLFMLFSFFSFTYLLLSIVDIVLICDKADRICVIHSLAYDCIEERIDDLCRCSRARYIGDVHRISYENIFCCRILLHFLICLIKIMVESILTF